MADEGDNAQLQTRIKELEEQLVEAQKRAHKEDSEPKEQPKSPPPEPEQASSSAEAQSESSQEPPVNPAHPQQPPFYPMFPPQFYPMNYMQPQMSYPGMMPPGMMSSPMSPQNMMPGPQMMSNPMQQPMMSNPMQPPMMPNMMSGMMPGMMQGPGMMSMMPPQSYPPQYPPYDGSYWSQRTPMRPSDPQPPHPDSDLQAEINHLKDHYEDILKEKDDEIDQLRQSLQDRPPSEPVDPSLQRRVKEAEDEAALSKKEIELARDYIERFKAQVEERDKALRAKLIEMEAEMKGQKDRAEKLEVALNSERLKFAAMSEKAAQTEDLFNELKERFTTTAKDLDELKRARLQYSLKYQSDLDALKREIKSLNNALEQANLQLDQAKYDLQNSERRARVNGQEYTNVEINRLTQQVHMLQRQLEATGDNYAKFVELQNRQEGVRQSTGRVQYANRPAGEYGKDYERPKTQRHRVTIQEPERDQDWSLRKSRSSDSPHGDSNYEWSTSIRSASESLERELVTLQQEKQQLDSEYLKLPNRSKTMIGKKRREEVESRLKAIDSQMASLKGQLRGLKVLRK